MVDSRVTNACEQVDAMVFTGDGLYDQESLNKFKEYLKRWNKELSNVQIVIDDIN